MTATPDLRRSIASAEAATLLGRLALSPAEAAESLGLSPASIYRALSAGELHAVKRGGRWLIPVTSLRVFCGESVEPAPAPLPPSVRRLVEAALA